MLKKENGLQMLQSLIDDERTDGSVRRLLLQIVDRCEKFDLDPDYTSDSDNNADNLDNLLDLIVGENDNNDVDENDEDDDMPSGE